MKEFKAIKVDDKVNTINYGLVEITDLFVSPRTNKIVYQALCLDGSFLTAIVTEDELREVPCTHN